MVGDTDKRLRGEVVGGIVPAVFVEQLDDGAHVAAPRLEQRTPGQVDQLGLDRGDPIGNPRVAHLIEHLGVLPRDLARHQRLADLDERIVQPPRHRHPRPGHPHRQPRLPRPPRRRRKTNLPIRDLPHVRLGEEVRLHRIQTRPDPRQSPQPGEQLPIAGQARIDTRRLPHQFTDLHPPEHKYERNGRWKGMSTVNRHEMGRPGSARLSIVHVRL
jgi:hypothetical protein